MVSEIVAYELDQDDANNVCYVLMQDGVNPAVQTADPRTFPSDRSELEGKIAHLKVRFGERVVKDMIKRFPEPKEAGMVSRGNRGAERGCKGFHILQPPGRSSEGSAEATTAQSAD